jgi:hypothetical protein
LFDSRWRVALDELRPQPGGLAVAEPVRRVAPGVGAAEEGDDRLEGVVDRPEAAAAEGVAVDGGGVVGGL